MRLSSSLTLLVVMISAESLTLGPTTSPAALASKVPSKGTPSPTSQLLAPSSLPAPSTPAPSFSVVRPSPRPSFPVARPSPRPTLGSTKPPVAAAVSPVFAPVAIFQPFAPFSQPTSFGNTPTLPVGAWTPAPVAMSLDVCVLEDARLNACSDSNAGTCSNDSCANILFNSNPDASACEALGVICAALQCCNVCVEETNAYGVCLMNVLQCSDNQCNSSAESNAIVVTIVFLASMVGFGMLW